MEDTPRLENWALIVYWAGHATPADVQDKRVILTGTVYGHPNGKRYDPPTRTCPADGQEIFTTRVQNFDSVRGEARTKNTVYRLGKMGPEFSKWLETNKISLSQFDDAFHEKAENHQSPPEGFHG